MYSYTKMLQTLNEGKFGDLKEMLEANIREEAATKNGNKKPLTIIASMFKSIKNVENMYNKAIPMKDGRFAFIDGHRIFIADTDMGYNERNYFQLDQMFDTLFDREVDVDVIALKQFIAIHKGDKKGRGYNPVPFIIECEDGFKIGVNPRYLKDAIDFSGITKLKFTKSMGNIQKQPLFFVDDNDKVIAVVLPVNIRDVENDIEKSA